MKRLHPVKIDDALYYEKQWSEEFRLRPYYDSVRMRALSRDVKDGMRVLDVGAGIFGTCQFIAQNTNIKADLWAIDQSYTARDIVRKIAPSVTFVLGDVTALPFQDGEFDVVVAGEIIEHMEDPAAFAKELCRVGRSVALSTVDTKCPNALKREYPEHLWEFEPTELLGFFSPWGTATYEVVGNYHFIYVHH